LKQETGFQHLLSLARADLRAGLAGRALERIGPALRERPTHAGAREVRAEALLRLGEYRAALPELEALVADEPKRPEARYLLGMACMAVPRLEPAVARFRECLQLKPGHRLARFALANALLAMAEVEQALQLYDELVGSWPDWVQLHQQRGAALRLAGRREEAVAAFRRLLDIEPRFVMAWVELGNVLKDLERYPQAIECYQRALELQPDFADAACFLGSAWLSQGNPDAALSALDRCLALRPADRRALAYRGIALREAGHDQQAERLLDVDRLVRIRECAVPAGYPSLDAFNAALSRAILEDPGLTWERVGNTTRGGYQTGNLTERDASALAAMRALIGEAVGDYFRSLVADPEHPFASRRPSAWRVNMWAVALENSGHQLPHIHPDAWLSGVYYCQVPPFAGTQEQAGWLEFGRPPAGLRTRRSAKIDRIEPRNGRMVLFPSYFHHSTVPFEADQHRISLAFDIIPAADGSGESSHA
jgi:uncharacterized protein (TIGR02466 family)